MKASFKSSHSSKTGQFFAKTRSAFLWTRLLNIPFWAIFNILPVILVKDLHASLFQLNVIVILKPISSLFSPYWSQSIYERQDRLVPNLVWANILKFLPFLFFPWWNNPWPFVFSFGIYMLFVRGVIPAWMEIIKLNVQGTARERLFAFGSAIDYLGSAILPIAFAWILDAYDQSWRWIFFSTACLGILSTLALTQIPRKRLQGKMTEVEKLPFSQQLLKPWKMAWKLICERRDFASFQYGFMIGGSGLMLMQTTLPLFFVEALKLSYTEILVAVTICKAAGFAISSPFWVKKFDKMNIYYSSSWTTLIGACSIGLLICAIYHPIWLYVSYFVYGIMQAGSELCWHLSGPLFAKDKDSSTYSSTNVLSVGLRGCVAPLLGTLIYSLTNAITVMVIGSLMCLLATERMRAYGKRYCGGKGKEQFGLSNESEKNEETEPVLIKS